jgi:L-fuconolactonase
MRIDCHHHFWEMSAEWEAKMKAGKRERADVWMVDHGPTRLAEEMEKVGIEKTVLVEAWDYDRELNIHWMERAEELDMVGAVIGWADPFSLDFGELLDDYVRFSKFRGVRFRGKFVSDPDWLRQPEVHRAIRELASRDGLSLDLHVAKPLLTEFPIIAEENPDLPMNLNHLSNPQLDEAGYFEPWAALMEPLREIPNLTFKVSAITEFAGPEPTVELLRPVAKFMVETYGCDRLMYGSNWPVCRMATEYQETFELTMAAVGSLSAADEARILGGTAVEYYRIA